MGWSGPTLRPDPIYKREEEAEGVPARDAAHPFRDSVVQPVTGGVKTPVTPTRLVLQRLLAIGEKIRTPAFFILIERLMTPWALEALVFTLIFGPLIRTWIPLTAAPPWLTWMVSFVFRPTNSCFGVTLLTATQGVGGGEKKFTTTDADAVLLL